MRSEDNKRQDSHRTETVQSSSGNGVLAGRWTPYDAKQIMRLGQIIYDGILLNGGKQVADKTYRSDDGQFNAMPFKQAA